MDGDVAPVAELAHIRAAHDALLVLDEAHAVLGPDPDLTSVEALRVGTLSKTLGSLGGFVAGPSPLIELILNRARAFIFTTAATPGDAAAALAALRVLRSGEGEALRVRLHDLVQRARPSHPSPIIPIVLGEEAAALAASTALLERGLLVPAIRPPTVAPGTSRLRVALPPPTPTATSMPFSTPLARSSRPERLVVVVGTGTGIGKTWVTCRLARHLQEYGSRVAARKPAQSFEPTIEATDAHLLATATDEQPSDVCPPHRSYPLPMAPPMAAQALVRPPILIADLVSELHWPPGTEVGLVETAGGVRSPLADDGDAIALSHALAPDQFILVAGAGLGTLNDVRLAIHALRAVAAPVVVHLNRYDSDDELHLLNRTWLVQHDRLDVTTSIETLARVLP
ncbi:MAG: aminotransferase class I/II-fold pyridoxal phosphate-dependent enzyme [Acidimicrobiales bacterium]